MLQRKRKTCTSKDHPRLPSVGFSDLCQNRKATLRGRLFSFAWARAGVGMERMVKPFDREGQTPIRGGTRSAGGQTAIRKRPIGGADAHPRGSLSAGSDAHPEAPDRRPLGACPYRRRCAECSPLKFIGGSSQTVIGVRNGHSGVGDLRISASQDGKICPLCMI